MILYLNVKAVLRLWKRFNFNSLITLIVFTAVLTFFDYFYNLMKGKGKGKGKKGGGI